MLATLFLLFCGFFENIVYEFFSCPGFVSIEKKRLIALNIKP